MKSFYTFKKLGMVYKTIAHERRRIFFSKTKTYWEDLEK